MGKIITRHPKDSRIFSMTKNRLIKMKKTKRKKVINKLLIFLFRER